MNLVLSLLILFSIIVLYLINLFSFDNSKPTCDFFVLNIYLYLALSILILGLSISLINWSFLLPYSFLIFIFSLITIIFIAFQKQYQTTMQEVISSHLSWFLFIILISSSLSVYFQKGIYGKPINDAIIATSLVFVIMSSIVYMIPEFFKSTYGFMSIGLLISLIAVIIIELFLILFEKDPKSLFRKFRIISYFVILIFSLYVSYDTIRTFELAEKCNNMPNYPKASIDFFLDIINLFSRFALLNSTGGRR